MRIYIFLIFWLFSPSITFSDNNKASAWEVDVNYDELTRKESTRLYIKSLYPIRTRTGNENHAYLNIKGDGEKISVWIWWDRMISTSNAYLTYRLGDGELIESEKWYVSNSYESTFPEDQFLLMLQLLQSFHSMFRVTPYNENPITAEFINSRGLEDLLLKHKSAFKPLWDWNQNITKRTADESLTKNIADFLVIKKIKSDLYKNSLKIPGITTFTENGRLYNYLKKNIEIDILEDDILLYIEEFWGRFFVTAEKLIYINLLKSSPVIIDYKDIASVNFKSRRFLFAPVPQYSVKVYVNNNRLGRFSLIYHDDSEAIETFIKSLVSHNKK